jgi:hypothetical protein
VITSFLGLNSESFTQENHTTAVNGPTTEYHIQYIRPATDGLPCDWSESMLPITATRLRVIRLGLLICTFGWGISFFFTIESWERAVARLQQMGAEPITYQPLMAYWLKMASAVFGCIGIASGLAFHWPQRFAAVIQLLAPFHLIVGVTLITAAIGNDLSPARQPTFVWDIAFCFTVATLVGLPLVHPRPAAD